MSNEKQAIQPHPAATFIQLIHREHDPECNFRIFHDFEKSLHARNFTGKFSELENELKTYNQLGYGVFLVINSGGHKDAFITHYNAVFVDNDTGQGLPEKWHIRPNIILQRDNNWHAYWLLPKDNDYDEQRFRTVQKQLVKYYDGDPKVCNPSRIMRLPGFGHHKKEGML